MKKILLYFILIVGILLIYVIVGGSTYLIFGIPKQEIWLLPYVLALTTPSYLISIVFDRWFKNRFIKSKKQTIIL